MESRKVILDSVAAGIYVGCGIYLWYRLLLFLPERGYSSTLRKYGLSYTPLSIYASSG